jgi:hypothetical protein
MLDSPSTATYRLVHDLPGHESFSYATTVLKDRLAPSFAHVPPKRVQLNAPIPLGSGPPAEGLRGVSHLTLLPAKRMRDRFGDDVLGCIRHPGVQQTLLDIAGMNGGDTVVNLSGLAVREVSDNRQQKLVAYFNLVASDEHLLAERQRDVIKYLAQVADVPAQEVLEMAKPPHVTAVKISAGTWAGVFAGWSTLKEVSDGFSDVVSPEKPLPVVLGRLLLPPAY